MTIDRNVLEKIRRIVYPQSINTDVPHEKIVKIIYAVCPDTTKTTDDISNEVQTIIDIAKNRELPLSVYYDDHGDNVVFQKSFVEKMQLLVEKNRQFKGLTITPFAALRQEARWEIIFKKLNYVLFDEYSEDETEKDKKETEKLNLKQQLVKSFQERDLAFLYWDENANKTRRDDCTRALKVDGKDLRDALMKDANTFIKRHTSTADKSRQHHIKTAVDTLYMLSDLPYQARDLIDSKMMQTKKVKAEPVIIEKTLLLLHHHLPNLHQAAMKKVASKFGLNQLSLRWESLSPKPKQEEKKIIQFTSAKITNTNGTLFESKNNNKSPNISLLISPQNSSHNSSGSNEGEEFSNEENQQIANELHEIVAKAASILVEKSRFTFINNASKRIEQIASTSPSKDLDGGFVSMNKKK